MKKNLITLLVLFISLPSFAQNINPDGGDMMPARRAAVAPTTAPYDSLSGWSIDGNLTAGLLWQNLHTTGMTGYSQPINSSISDVKFENGVSRGFDVGVSYYFGKHKNYGIGMGLMYLYQQGDLTIDHMHVEYKSTDYFGNTFRQVLTANGQIKENITTSNLSIPVLFKYNRWFNKRAGFNMDMGLIFNVLEQNEVNANASFDYEAIYKYTGSQGNITPVYDNSPTPSASDLIITRSRYEGSNTTSQSVNDYFNSLSAQGYNVGLGVHPTYNKGAVDYNRPSVGFLLRPAIGVMLHHGMSLNFGLYYLYQNFTNDAASNYMITDKRGTYNPIANSVTQSQNHSAGISVGFRYTFPAKKAPVVAEPPAPADEPVVEPAEPAEEDKDEVYEPPVSYTSPILFDLDKTTIRPEAYPILEAAVTAMHDNSRGIMIINGYTDNTGAVTYNKALSKKRAVAVKNYLHKKGIRSRSMRVVGHGPKNPAASNRTAEGRQKNRRVELRMKQSR